MTQAAESIVAVLALIRRRLNDLASDLQKDNLVTLVLVDVAARQYPSEDRVECYVDAELSIGHSFGCWLEFWHEEGSWIVESSIRLNTSEGENELLGLPTRFAVDDGELVSELEGASSALVEAARRVELSGL